VTISEECSRISRISSSQSAPTCQFLGIERRKQNEAVRHLRLWRKLRQVEKLRPNDRRALLKMLDALLAQQDR